MDTPKIWLPDDRTSITVDDGGEWGCTVSQMRITFVMQPIQKPSGFGKQEDKRDG